MSDQSNDKFRRESLLAHGGEPRGSASGPAVPPVQLSTTFLRDDAYELAADGQVYGRDDNATVVAVERVVTRLEGAADALAFSSGMAAIAALMRTVAGGDAIVLQSGIYWGTTQWARDFSRRRDIRLVEVDATDAVALAQAIADTRPALVFIETPSNPWLGIVDIRAAAAAAHSAGAILAVDSTVATPILTNPLDMGADIVMHSATKALNGHSDVVAGVLAAADTTTPVWNAVRADRKDAGAILGGFEAWLLLRGLRTLALRVERMSENAERIASFLDAHRGVRRVHYPGLVTHPGHEVATRQMMGGYGGLLSFQIAGDADDALAICGRLKLIGRATSLGGVESLMEHRHSVEGPGSEVPADLLRLSVGIEHVDDLIGDIDRAL